MHRRPLCINVNSGQQGALALYGTINQVGATASENLLITWTDDFKLSLHHHDAAQIETCISGSSDRTEIKSKISQI